ncbi:MULTISPECIES: mannose-6-phosphate isomerase, class I [Arthrobacter]|uniref:mannose-6-phosphate isomerase n=1 Tax=Arthrobacter terricola TaxID=2547396 RepID=A0A4R5KNC4_9MICC|nr:MULTISPECIES: mannose-6-phosphate isomerase, class I [Arthrobacter]MBT8161199.1 mannose-6-phosphate isomerase, class I [Arthrobacter sp. GN70]TDF96445.1 mannose-6-phosphate isomerase, class I [Arthrobacter terricola]
MYQLENVLRPYAWGSTTAISSLLGRPASGGPEAELWIGAHPDSPSVATRPDGSLVGLDELISTDPAHFLGESSVAEFGPRLPFLTKLLAADKPLSLQVHPRLQQAREGYARENAAGLAADSPERNYRDDNHKPEMILALTPFQALCGFRPAARSRRVFEHLAKLLDLAVIEVPEIISGVVADLSMSDESTALRAAFTRLIDGGEAVSAATEEVVSVLRSGAPMGQHTAELTALQSINNEFPGDPGVLISLLLNLVFLDPGDAIYLPGGNVHAYLKGFGVEVMAASDNVLRGGLTPKHVDVPELLKNIEFESLGVPHIWPSTTGLGQDVYVPPFREFQLQRIELAPGAEPVPLAQAGPAVVLVVSGDVVLDSPKSELGLAHGGSAFIPASEEPVMVHPAMGSTAPSIAFAVTTGQEN